MTPADHLYQLIKSLTPSEKRYFKIFSKRHVVGGQNKYDKLFDIYDGLSDDGYDEAALKLILKKKDLGKNLSDDKKNLLEMVMRAMLNFHAGETVDQQLSDLLAEEDFYRQKRLNGLRAKVITRAKELAEKYDKPMVMHQLIERETAMRTEIEQDKLKEIAADLGSDKDMLLNKIKILSDLLTLNGWLFIQYRLNAKTDSKDFWEKVKEKMDIPSFREYNPGLSFNTDRTYYSICSFYYILKKDYVLYNQHVRRQYELYDEYPHQKDNSRVSYKLALFNYIYSLQIIKDFDSMKALLDFAKSIEPLNEDDAGESFQNLVFYRQLYFMNTMKFAEAAAMAVEIEEGIKKYRRKVNKARELTLYSNIAISNMILEDWDRVATYTEKIIADKTDVRMDIKYEAMLHQLIARYEMKHYDLLSYQSRNVQRALSAKGVLTESQSYIIRQLNLLNKNGKEHWDVLRRNPAHSISVCDGYSGVKIWLYARIHSVDMVTAALSH